MLCAERLVNVLGKVQDATNRAYMEAVQLAPILEAVQVDLWDIHEIIRDLEPSRDELKTVEMRLYKFPRLVELLARGKPEWWERCRWLEHPTQNPSEDVRVQGGVSVALAQKIAEARDDLERQAEQELEDARLEVDRMRHALDSLSPDLMDVVRLRFFERKHVEMIAMDLNISPQRVYQLKDDALTTVKRGLKD